MRGAFRFAVERLSEVNDTRSRDLRAGPIHNLVSCYEFEPPEEFCRLTDLILVDVPSESLGTIYDIFLRQTRISTRNYKVCFCGDSQRHVVQISTCLLDLFHR